MSIINWGSVPDWCAGIGALTALFFARRAAIAALATNEQQSKQLAQLERAAQDSHEEQRRHQASLVAVWLEDSESDPLKVCYLNASKQPVYDVRIMPEIFAGDIFRSIRIPVLPPTTEVEVSQKSSDLLRANLINLAKENTTQGGLTEGSDEHARQVKLAYRELKRQARNEGVSVEFHDSSGVIWRRSHRGALTEVLPT